MANGQGQEKVSRARKLYNTMSGSFEMADDFETFNTKLYQDEGNRRKAFDTMSGSFDMGAWDVFNQKLLDEAPDAPSAESSFAQDFQAAKAFIPNKQTLSGAASIFGNVVGKVAELGQFVKENIGGMPIGTGGLTIGGAQGGVEALGNIPVEPGGEFANVIGRAGGLPDVDRAIPLKESIQIPMAPISKLLPETIPESFRNLPIPTPGGGVLYSPETNEMLFGGLRGLALLGEGLSTPMNIGLLLGTAGLSGGGSRAISALFSVDMARALPELTGQFVEAVKAGDIQKAAELLVQAAGTAAFAIAAGRHATKGRSKKDVDVFKDAFKPEDLELMETLMKEKGFETSMSPELRAEVREGIGRLTSVEKGVKEIQKVAEKPISPIQKKWEESQANFKRKENLAKIREEDSMQEWAERYTDYYEEGIRTGEFRKDIADPVREIAKETESLYADDVKQLLEFENWIEKEQAGEIGYTNTDRTPGKLKSTIVDESQGRVSQAHLDKIETAVKFAEFRWPKLMKKVDKIKVLDAETFGRKVQAPRSLKPFVSAYYESKVVKGSPLDVAKQEWYRLTDELDSATIQGKTDTNLMDRTLEAKKKYDNLRNAAEGRGSRTGNLIIKAEITSGNPYGESPHPTIQGQFEKGTKSYLNDITHEAKHNYDWNKRNRNDVKYAEEKGRIEEETSRFGESAVKAYTKFLEGGKEMMKGLAELLKVDPNTLQAVILPFNPGNYKQFLPHFKKGWKAYKEAGKSFELMSSDLINSMGEGVKPYLEKFGAELAEGKIRAPEVDKALEKDDSPPIEHPVNQDAAVVTGSADTTPPTQFKDLKSNLSDWLMSPEYALIGDPKRPRKNVSEAAQTQVSNTIDAETNFRWEHSRDRMFFDEMLSELRRTPEGRKISRNEFRDRKKGLRSMIKMLYEGDKATLTEMNNRHPVTFEVASKMKTWFEGMREYIKAYKRDIFRKQAPEDIARALDDWYQEPNIPLEYIARERNIDLKEFTEYVKEYQEIDKWGFDEYVTNIEVGPWKVMREEINAETGQVETHVVAIGRNKKAAFEKAKDITKEQPGIGPLKVEADFARTDPLKPSKEILRGEEDIFDAIIAYSFKIRQRANLHPQEINLKMAKEALPGDLPPNVVSLLENQLDYAGGKYFMSDRLADGIVRDLAEGYGHNWDQLTKTQKAFRTAGLEGLAARTSSSIASRGIAQVRKVIGNLKLGYRVVGGLINAGGGYGHTWTKVGVEYMVKAAKFKKTPEGKRFIVQEEPFMGMDFVADISGKLHVKGSRLSPLHIFGMPEPGIRRTSLAANYLYAKEKMNMSDTQARMFARRSNRFQSFVYNASAINTTLRTPIAGKLLGQFKTYLSKEIEFVHSLRGQEIARYLGMHMALGGPRAIVYMIRSIPILGAHQIWDKVDDWMNKQTVDLPLIGPVSPLGGIAGALGADITAPAAFQLPGSPEEWGGPLSSDLTTAYKNIMKPLIEGVDPSLIQGDAIKWVKSLAPIAKNWDEIVKSVVDDDGWVWDENKQVKLYQVGDWFDRFIMASGAPILEKTSNQMANHILDEGMRVKQENRRRAYRDATKALRQGQAIPDHVVENLGVWGLTGEGLRGKLKRAHLNPALRRLVEAELTEKIRALEIFEGIPGGR